MRVKIMLWNLITKILIYTHRDLPQVEVMRVAEGMFFELVDLQNEQEHLEYEREYC